MPSNSLPADEPLLPLLARAVRRWVGFCVNQALALLDLHVGSNIVVRFLAVLLVYATDLTAVFYLAYEMRWDFATPPEMEQQRASLIVAVVVCKLILLHSFGQFRSILSYFGLADFGGVVVAMSVASGMMLTLWYASDVAAAPSRGVILMDFVLSVALLSAFRLTLRVVRTRNNSGRMRPAGRERRVAIIGAGDAG